MNVNQRLLLAASIVLVDIVVFVFPLTACFAAYLILQRPPWFREWVLNLYRD